MNAVKIGKMLKAALFICTLGLAASTSAFAQSSTGNIRGDAVVGDIVTIHGPDNGFHRELTIEKEGKYRVSRVPAGDYDVTIQHADGTVEAKPTVTVRVGSTARVL